MTRYLVARANLMVFGVLVVILCLVGAMAWERLNASREAREWSMHSYRVLTTTKDLSIALRDAERGQRGYLLTGNPDYLSPYNAARDRIGVLQGELQKLTSDNMAQQERLRVLAPVAQHKLEELAQTVQARRDGGLESALRIVATDAGRNHMKDAEAILDVMLVDEQRLLDERLAQNDARAAWVRWLVIGGSVLAVLTLLWAARLLNQAWSRSHRTEAEQRDLALRLRTTLDSLSQGVAVFGPDRRLVSWNECFQVHCTTVTADVSPAGSGEWPYRVKKSRGFQVYVFVWSSRYSSGRRAGPHSRVRRMSISAATMPLPTSIRPVTVPSGSMMHVPPLNWTVRSSPHRLLSMT
jgi:CHASE3 domain sensor protein